LKSFSRYISFNRDNDELLLSVLQVLVREHVRLDQYRSSAQHRRGMRDVEIDTEEFESRVCYYYYFLSLLFFSFFFVCLVRFIS